VRLSVPRLFRPGEHVVAPARRAAVGCHSDRAILNRPRRSATAARSRRHRLPPGPSELSTRVAPPTRAVRVVDPGPLVGPSFALELAELLEGEARCHRRDTGLETFNVRLRVLSSLPRLPSAFHHRLALEVDACSRICATRLTSSSTRSAHEKGDVGNKPSRCSGSGSGSGSGGGGGLVDVFVFAKMPLTRVHVCVSEAHNHEAAAAAVAAVVMVEDDQQEKEEEEEQEQETDVRARAYAAYDVDLVLRVAPPAVLCKRPRSSF
jgi:hypothetical protein